MSYDDIITIALSGIASQRISDTTGYSSSTIQSLLVKAQRERFFPYKAILLDEASNGKFSYFLSNYLKNKWWYNFIIVGDDGQLPAIGAGNILADSIKFELAPICKLTKIYRQNENQAIAVIANDIRKENYQIIKKIMMILNLLMSLFQIIIQLKLFKSKWVFKYKRWK